MENKPVLKKVRRPINRAQPISSSEPTTGVVTPQKNVQEEVANVAMPNNQPPMEDNLPPQVENQPFSQNIPDNLPSVERAHSRNYSQTNYNYNEEPQYENDEYPEEYFAEDEHRVSVKLFVFCFVLALIVGALLGKYLLGAPQVSHNGLQGIVANSEVPRGRARCGVADRTQGCVLYIMNPQRKNVKAKDFYDMAAQMTGRQRFMIETGNMRYANTEIRPGDIAQLNIPPL